MSSRAMCALLSLLKKSAKLNLLHFRNRFYISRKKKIRFFVEDDADKANKLAYICDIVFLMRQPYDKNQKLPNNVVRVGSWDELYRQVRKYC